MTAKQTLPKNPADEDRREFEQASKELDSMDGTQMAGGFVAPPARVVGSRGGRIRTREDMARERGMTLEQFEDHVVETDNWFHRPIKGTKAREKHDAEYAERQRLKKLKSSGEQR